MLRTLFERVTVSAFSLFVVCLVVLLLPFVSVAAPKEILPSTLFVVEVSSFVVETAPIIPCLTVRVIGTAPVLGAPFSRSSGEYVVIVAVLTFAGVIS